MIIYTFSCVSLLILVLFIGATLETKESEHVPKLFWSPNNAGLFSQYLQMKLLIHHAAALRRKLILLATTSPHYQDSKIVMCDIFMLPQNVSCGNLPDKMRCTKNFDVIVGAGVSDDVCYSGSVAFNSGVRVRSLIIKSVDILLPVPFQFTAMYEKTSTTLYNALLKATCSSTMQCRMLGNVFTVVHWRRGDQLLGRCQKGVDTSVNCHNASALVLRVREFSSDPTVYVATNEPHGSREMAELRRLGFVTFQDVARDAHSLQGASDFAILAAETSLMLSATTFLAWGVSEINDVVEHERREAGLSHCLGQDQPAQEVQHNWCTTHGHSNGAAK